MISCEYIGRMGNNMFQIAAGASLAHINRDIFDIRNWKYKNVFKLDKNIVNLNNNSNYEIYNESGFHYTEIDYKNNLRLYGYFQSEKYFDKEYVKNIFSFKEKIYNYVFSKYSKILDNETLSIHVRRGDYLSLQHQHPVQTLEYFNNAINEVGKNKGIEKILIFSDDIEYCKEVFLDNRVIFIQEEDYIDMCIFSLCKNNIISNSSFSWWGAWLNNNEDKVVIAPKKWFGPHYSHLETRDLYSQGWIVI